ncbi:MAG: hypothetical protein HQL11_03945, partial [Candidatus Omnitrophica bacterium]|nr:hypothetical protein [Candidatus Omnitrophota bacterium]
HSLGWSWSSALLSGISVIAVAAMTARALPGKNARALFALTAFMVPALVFLAAAAIGAHTVFTRHFVWTGGLCAWSIAGALLWLTERKPSAVLMARIALALLAAVLLAESIQVTRETFSIEDVRGWFRAHRIDNRQVLTSWWQVNSRKDPGPTSFVPGGFVAIESGDRSQRNFGEGPAYKTFRIFWPEVLKRYRAGEVRYLLTSGIDLRASLGLAEAPLTRALPLMSWPHPYAVYKHRYQFLLPDKTINLYDLKEIFTINTPN